MLFAVGREGDVGIGTEQIIEIDTFAKRQMVKAHIALLFGDEVFVPGRGGVNGLIGHKILFELVGPFGILVTAQTISITSSTEEMATIAFPFLLIRTYLCLYRVMLLNPLLRRSVPPFLEP